MLPNAYHGNQGNPAQGAWQMRACCHFCEQMPFFAAAAWYTISTLSKGLLNGDNP
jgi:hypothetical protein